MAPYLGSNSSFCPPTAAEAIKPPFVRVKTATPSFHVASTFALAFAAVADAPACSVSWPCRKRPKEVRSRKKMISLYDSPPMWKPMLAPEIFASPT